MTNNEGSQSTSTHEPDSPIAGAAAQRPPMTPEEMLDRIKRASGRFTPMRELRSQLPTAQAYQAPGERQRDAPLRPEAAARGGAGAAAGAAIAPLTMRQRELLIDQAILMLDDLYAHLPLKRALHATDPIQRLRLLRLRHEALDEREFQSAMIDIFVGLRDLHTNYILPSEYHPKYAFLPFRVEEYYENKQRKYLVSAVSPINTDANLTLGIEITHWNGVPIDIAVARNASREAGSNEEARRARGLEALTLRWLGMSLPPDEDWVVLTYSNGKESRIQWQSVEPDTPEVPSGGTRRIPLESKAAIGLDVKTELLRRVRKTLFNASGLKVDAEVADRRKRGAAPVAEVSVLPDVYPLFGMVQTPSGKFGYVRLATFAPEGGAIDAAVDEFVRILRTLPSSGLILDVRGNGGGYVNFGERILQTLSPSTITPEPFHFMSTPFTLSVAQTENWLTEWAQPLATSLATGAGFSQGFPVTSPESCNDIGQVYQGPVVLITDAFCYSTTDIFAAGFQDHGVGVILGCHENTGAGGANVWDYGLLEELSVTPNPFKELPRGASMRVAARRSTRVGARAGVPLEDLGVTPDERYFMTRDDLLKGNVDLIAYAAKLLAARPRQTLQVEAVGGAPVTQVRVTATNLDRVDLHVDERPVASVDITSSPTVIALPKPVAAGRVVAHGYRSGTLVVSAGITIP
jgi:peptidase S41-like protein